MIVEPPETSLDNPTSDNSPANTTVRIPGLVAQSMGATGVEINAFSVSAVVTLFAGALAPFAYVIAALCGIAFARVIGKFSRSLVTAGGTYQFIRRGLGDRAGIFGGSIYFMGIFVFVPFTAVLAATVFASFMMSALPNNTYFREGHWFAMATAILLLSAFLCYRGLKLSVIVLVSLVVIGVVAIAIFDLAILIQIDYSTVQFSDLLPWHSNGVTFGSFAVALGLAMGGFFASETAVFLGEEAHAPKRTIPRAVMLSVIVMMVILVVNSLALTLAVGTDNTHTFAEQGVGIIPELSARYLGAWYGDLLLLVIALACFTSVLALFTSNARLLFDWGREGTVPQVFGKIARERSTPTVAVVVLLAASVGVAVIGLLLTGDTIEDGTGLFSWVLLAGALWILLGYVLLGLAAIAQEWRENRGTARSWRACTAYVAPIVVVVAMSLSIISQMTPFPPPPLNTAPVLSLAWVLASVVIAVIWHRRRRAKGLASDGGYARIADADPQGSATR